MKRTSGHSFVNSAMIYLDPRKKIDSLCSSLTVSWDLSCWLWWLQRFRRLSWKKLAKFSAELTVSVFRLYGISV